MASKAEQRALWGITVEARGRTVAIELDGAEVVLTPRQAQRFAAALAAAYARAGNLHREKGNWVLDR